MSIGVTDEDLAHFAALGYPAPVQAKECVDPAGLAQGLYHVLESPAARLLEAASLVLVRLAREEQVERLLHMPLSDEALRRLGYLSDRLARVPSLAPSTRATCRELGKTLDERCNDVRPPLTFASVTTDAYVRQLQERSDELADKWGVYGASEPLESLEVAA